MGRKAKRVSRRQPGCRNAMNGVTCPAFLFLPEIYLTALMLNRFYLESRFEFTKGDL